MAIDPGVERQSLKNAGVEQPKNADKYNVAKEMRQKVLDAKTSKRFLEMTAAGKATPLSKEARDNLADKAGAGQPGKDKLDRYDQILADSLQSKSYEHLSEAEKNKTRGEILPALGPVFAETIDGMTPDAKKTFADSIITDPSFKMELNFRMQELSRAKFTAKKEDIDNLAASLHASGAMDTTQTPPAPFASVDAARGAAYSQLEQQWQTELQRDIDSAAAYAAQQVLATNLEAAHNVVFERGDELDAEVTERAKAAGKDHAVEVAKKLRSRWDRPNADRDRNYGLNRLIKGKFSPGGLIGADWDRFAQGGLEGFLQALPTGTGPGQITVAERDALLANPDLMKDYEAQIGQDLLCRKLESGTLSREDLRKLNHAPWLGDTFDERVDRLGEVFTAIQKSRDLIEAGQAGGMIDTQTVDKIKDAVRKGALPGGLAGLAAALLAAIVLPVPTALTYASMAAGAGMGGNARYNRETKRYAA